MNIMKHTPTPAKSPFHLRTTDRGGLFSDWNSKLIVPLILCLNTLMLLFCGLWLTSVFADRHLTSSPCAEQVLLKSFDNGAGGVELSSKQPVIETSQELEAAPPPAPYVHVDENIRQHFHACRKPHKDYKGGVVPMTPVHVWRTSKPPKHESVTIVTQLSLGRLPMLMNQCLVWKDRIAAVVYTPMFKERVMTTDTADSIWEGMSIDQVSSRLEVWHKKIEKETGCFLDLELAVEHFEDRNDTYAGLYPVNALRNRAAMLAQTEAVLLLDVDFVPSAGLVEEYQTPAGYKDLMTQLAARKLFVLPAFLTTKNVGAEAAISTALFGKEAVIEAINANKLDAFSQCGYICHGLTDYPRWYKTKESYSVIYKKPYEPYLLAARAYVPWYDERFRGYYQNKIVHRVHFSVLDVQFLVHPRQFVIHVPHAKSAAYGATIDTGIKYKNFALASRIRVETTEGTFVPVTSFADDPKLCPSNEVVALKNKS